MESNNEQSMYKASQFTMSTYKNKKGEKKYQLVVDESVLLNIINGDKNTLTFINTQKLNNKDS